MAELDPDQLRPLASLEDETRRRLYEFVVSTGEPVTRDVASRALGLDRPLVAYHLDRLADEGLLAVSFARPDGRGGPGAGRPAKHYQRADVEMAIGVPPRDYQLAAEVLVRAMEEDDDGQLRQALEDVARRIGRDQLSDAETTDLMELLRRRGYEPYRDGDVVRLRNCPFHRLAREHTELVCGMNVAMLAGLTEVVDDHVEARLEPAPDRCCVAFVPT